VSHLLSVIDCTGTSLTLVTGSPYSKDHTIEYSYFMLAAVIVSQPPIIYPHHSSNQELER